MSARATRRQVLLRGVGAAAGLSALAPAAAWADSGDATASREPPQVQDGRILQQLLNVEGLLMYGYEHAVGTGYLKHDARELALLQLAHEEAHMAELHSGLEALNLRRAPSKQEPSAHSLRQSVDQLFNAAQHEREALQVVVQIENVAQSSYFKAAAGFNKPALVKLATEVLACEAQHWTMLVNLLHKGDATQAVPHPFVRGSMHIGVPHTPKH